MTWGAVAAAGITAVGTYAASENAKSGASGGSSTASSEPWWGQQAYLQRLFSDAENLYDNGSPYYEGQLTPDINSNLQSYFNQPNVELDQGFLDSIRSITNGPLPDNIGFDQKSMDAVTNNPYLQEQVDSLAADVNKNASTQIAQNNMNAGMMGTTGSSASAIQNALVQKEANDTIANGSLALRTNAFDKGITAGMNGANNRLTGLGLQANTAANGLSTTYQNSQQNYQNLRDAGVTEYGTGQDAINADMARWTYEDDAWNNLQRFRDMVSGNFVSSTSTSTGASPYQASSLESALGGALAGYGMYNQFQANQPTNYSGISGVNQGSAQDMMLANQWNSNW